MKLYIMKQEAIEFFKNNIDLYYTNYFYEKTNKWMIDVYQQKCGESPFQLFREIEGFELYPIDSSVTTGEIEFNNCKLLYKAMSFLSPSKACDERLWAGLCNGTFYDYVRRRWKYDELKPKTSKNDISAILSRFYMGGSTVYRNTLSKCWWVGYHTYDSTRANVFEKLDIIGKNDISTKISDIFYSNRFSANKTILEGIVKGIEALQDDGVNLLARDHIRPALQYLNVIGGGILLDCLSSDDIKDIFVDYVYGILQEDDQSIDLNNDEETDIQNLDEDEINQDRTVSNEVYEEKWVTDHSRIKLKNLKTEEIKVYLVQRNLQTDTLPPLMELMLGKKVGDIVEFDDIEYELIEIIEQ